MDIDELKLAWQTLGQQLERHDTLQLRLWQEQHLDKARGSLRPLFWGQVAQILFGLVFIALASLLWISHPEHASTIVAGIVVHLYGVVTIICAGAVLGQISGIDYAAPVVEIQKRLARARTFYVRSGMVAGLPWWFLWVPILMVLAGLRDVDLMRTAPSLVWIGLCIGVAGLLATRWFHRWSRRPERAEFGRRLDDSLTGGSLRRAQALLAEVKGFERE